MLPAYTTVIADNFPNARPPYCVFHFIPAINKHFKKQLKEHRQANFIVGQRKEPLRVAFLLLKGKEKLTNDEELIVQDFSDQYPIIASAYALKEDIRTLYATAQTLPQAYALKDIILDNYAAAVSKTILPAITLFQTHFDKTIAYLHNGYFRDKTNNDAERCMRQIKRTPQILYLLRNPENYIRKIRVVLATQQPFAA